MTNTTQLAAHTEITAPISADLRRIEQEAQELPEPSPTAGMNIGQRILHVGSRENAAGYIEFGSVAAVRALVGQVLRDLKAATPAPQGEKVYAELPEPVTTGLGDECESFDRDGRAMGKAYETIRYFTADQMRNFADAAADLRSIPAPALAAAAQQGTTP